MSCDEAIWSQLVTNGAVTLCAAAAGALLGAYCAFKFERNAKKKDQENADIAAVQETTLCLAMMWNNVWNYRTQVVDPHRGHPLRHISMPATTESEESYELPWPRLVFLMSGHGDLLFGIWNIRDAFRLLKQSIKDRAHEHQNDIQPKLENAIRLGKSSDQDEENLLEVLGEKSYRSMQNRTNRIIEFTDRLYDEILPRIAALRNATKSIYPDADIPQMTPAGPHDPQNKENSALD